MRIFWILFNLQRSLRELHGPTLLVLGNGNCRHEAHVLAHCNTYLCPGTATQVRVFHVQQSVEVNVGILCV